MNIVKLNVYVKGIIDFIVSGSFLFGL